MIDEQTGKKCSHPPYIARERRQGMCGKKEKKEDRRFYDGRKTEPAKGAGIKKK